MKEIWAEQFVDPDEDRDAARAEMERVRAEEDEKRAVRERVWAVKYRAEWSEWDRILPLLMPVFDFVAGKQYDFPEFLSEVGLRPSQKHIIERRDSTLPYQAGNLVWVTKAAPKPEPRFVDSPYLTVDEAAAYCRRSRKTILNHHCLGTIRSMPHTRPPLFKREDLDAWVAGRKTRRK